MGDFNFELDEANMKVFHNYYKLKYLNKHLNCLKNVDKSFCINLFLNNSPECFENCLTLETGL